MTIAIVDDIKEERVLLRTRLTNRASPGISEPSALRSFPLIAAL